MNHSHTMGRLLLEALRLAGVRELFGIPGDFVLPLFRVIEQTGLLPLYTLSHEPGIGFAADGAARWSGRPSAAVVTYGAGALNMVNPVAAAYAEKVPVIVVSGGPGTDEQHSGLLLHHQAKRLDSQYEIYHEITCARTRLQDPETAPAELARVLSEAIRQSRPAYIEMPRDRAETPCGPPLPLDVTRACDDQALQACVDELLTALTRARSPVLMVGVEIRRLGLETQVAELARLLNMPIVTSFMGRGLLAGRGLPVCGTYLGVAGNPELTAWVEDSDALLMLGVILSDTNLGTSRTKLNLGNRCIVAQDGTVSLGYHTYAQIPLPSLITAMVQRLQAAPLPRAAATALLPPVSYPRGLQADDQPIVSDDIARGINDLVREQSSIQVVADIGDALFMAMDIEDTELAAPGYYATMGYAVPAGMGIQAATGRRPLIITGDGAFQMTGWELGNCPRHGWDPIVVVLNNSGWEMLRAFVPDARFNDLDTWRFAELAMALGGNGVRVETRAALQQALQAAFATRGQFQLIEVMVARGSMSRTMAQFVEGMAKQ